MASLYTSLYTGASGLFTSQTAIQVTGNNIANAGTTGYSRQVVNVTSNLPLTQGNLNLGTGSGVESINRAGDAFITKQLVAQNSTYGEYEAASSPLSDIEQILDISDSSLASDIDSFFDAWQELSTNPSGTSERQQVLQEAEDLANHFQQINQQIAQVVDGINTSIESMIPDLNDQLSQIANLNQSIMQTEIAGGDANTLRDQRDLLLQDVSESCGATMYSDQNGMVCLQLQNGQPLVTGNQASSLSVTKVNGLSQLSLVNGNTTTSLDADDFSGKIAGLLTTRDTTIPSVQSDIDKLAYTLASDINTLISTQGGVDKNGNTAGDLFSYTISTDPSAEAWTGAAGSLAVAFSDSSLLAAGTTNTTGDNSLCLAIVGLRTTKQIDGSSTYTEEYSRIAAKAGLMVDSNEQHLTTASQQLSDLSAKRDSAAGVSTDEEMVNLIQYQSGYQAASKYISTVKDMLDTLIQM